MYRQWLSRKSKFNTGRKVALARSLQTAVSNNTVSSWAQPGFSWISCQLIGFRTAQRKFSRSCSAFGNVWSGDAITYPTNRKGRDSWPLSWQANPKWADNGDRRQSPIRDHQKSKVGQVLCCHLRLHTRHESHGTAVPYTIRYVSMGVEAHVGVYELFVTLMIAAASNTTEQTPPEKVSSISS